MKKVAIISFLIILLGGLIFFIGEKPSTANVNGKIEGISPKNTQLLEEEIAAQEAAIIGMKEDNEAKIIWANDDKTKTTYSILYLHGFSASSGEGEPVHRLTASYFGCNLYMARLYKHGIEEENPLLDFKPAPYVNSAKEALKIASQLGEKVIVMATSAGGMLALYLAAQNPTLVHALVLYSPLVDFYDTDLHALNIPWGIEIGKIVAGSEFVGFNPKKELQKKYWTTRYRLEAVVNLVALNEKIMTPATFQKVVCPVFLGYYYKSETEQDQVVSVPAMLAMFNELGTADSLKHKVAFDDAKEHVITSEIVSGNWQRVLDSTQYFLAFTLDIHPIDELKEDILGLIE